MYQKIKKYLEISPGEFRGMLVFVLIMLFVYISPYIYEKLMFEPLKISIETLNPKIDSIQAFDEKKDRFYENEGKPKNLKLFRFNPNGLPISQWMQLGLTEKQALSIKKYESKGGQFKKLADVEKMYAIRPELYQKLEPYIDIPEAPTKSYSSTNVPSEKKWESRPAVIIEVNSADSATLTTVKGIGPSFAARIIKHRNKLGGFINPLQLKEVWGLDSLKYEQIKDQIHVNANNIKKLKINECTFEEIRYFPYLSYKQSNAIIAYRKQHGNFKNTSDLNKIAILNAEVIDKITPYLQF